MKENKLLTRILKEYSVIEQLYIVNLKELKMFSLHKGGRNIVLYNKELTIRISKNNDRTYEDYLSETRFLHYLAINKANTIDVILSSNNNLVEVFNNTFITAFTLAKGDQISNHNYRYLDNRPLSEYFFNTGKTLGKIHKLSKEYKPISNRFDFFDKYNDNYINELIPNRFNNLKTKIIEILNILKELPKSNANYGIIHFDFSDGNYNIDYTNGDITVFDFDNCRNFYYIYDLANLWVHGVGWIAYEEDPIKRKLFMDDYFTYIIKGYLRETIISNDDLLRLPLFIQVVLIENIIDDFEVSRSLNKRYKLTKEQAYRMKCIENNIEYYGFFNDIYNHNKPFEI